MANFFELKGKTITKISIDDDCVFECSDGSKYLLSHVQDCCESVDFVKLFGDLNMLIGKEITLAEEDTFGDDPDWYVQKEYRDDSRTWSKYVLAAGENKIEFYFLGESNGYYCETMDFSKLD